MLSSINKTSKIQSLVKKLISLVYSISGALNVKGISCILTVWLFCWRRSRGVTPDGAPCCCRPLSCRTAGSFQGF